jgi:hypothetical protein
MPLPDQPRKGPKRRDPLRDPPPQPLQDPPDQPLHDPEGDPTREPQQPFGDPTPSPAGDPPSEARAILIFNPRQRSDPSERIRHDRADFRCAFSNGLSIVRGSRSDYPSSSFVTRFSSIRHPSHRYVISSAVSVEGAGIIVDSLMGPPQSGQMMPGGAKTLDR